MVILVIAYVSYTYSEVTHNSMLTASGRPDALPMISGLGLGLGNLAATIMFIALVLLFALPAAIGWPFSVPQLGFDLARHEHVRIAGPLCAVWLVVFSIPFFTSAKDPGVKGASWTMAAIDGGRSVIRTIREAARYAQLMKFLLARMLYADAMAALLALGAVYVSLFLEWGFLEMTGYAIFASAWAFFGGLVGGWLDNKVGVKIALMLEILGMVIVLAAQLSITQEAIFFGMIDNYQVWDGVVFQSLSDLVYLSFAAVLAITATASISSSRTMLVALAPAGRSGEFFGLYAIAGTVTVWLGPLLVEIFTTAFNSQRIGMASIAILFALGLVILTFVQVQDEPAG
jgi:UMF1 family MFS transporter